MNGMMMSARKPQTKKSSTDMLKRYYTRNAEEKHKELRKQEKQIHKKKKKIYYEELLKENESLNSQKESVKFHWVVNNVRKEYKSRIIMCRKENGEIMSNKKESLDKWNWYFKQLLQGNEDSQPFETNTVDTSDGTNDDEVEKKFQQKIIN